MFNEYVCAKYNTLEYEEALGNYFNAVAKASKDEIQLHEKKLRDAQTKYKKNTKAIKNLEDPAQAWSLFQERDQLATVIDTTKVLLKKLNEVNDGLWAQENAQQKKIRRMKRKGTEEEEDEEEEVQYIGSE